MIRLFEVVEKNSEGVLFGAQEFSSTNLPCFIVYDVPVQGQTIETSGGAVVLPDYLTWKSYTTSATIPSTANNINSRYRTKTSTGLITNNPFQLPMTGTVYTANTDVKFNVLPVWNDCLFTNQQIRTFTGYDSLLETNFHIMTETEYQILKQLIVRLDFVRRRYPSRFEKKYLVEELLVFMEAALVDINLTPPVTRFWWWYTERLQRQAQINPMQASSNGAGGIPEILWSLVVDGAVIHALMAKGILEADLNFNYSDQGITLTYDNASHYSSWTDKMLQAYVVKKKEMKQNFRPTGLGLGTYSEVGLGYFGLINSAMDNRYNQIFYPFWLGASAGRAQF
jgi:hypothetical protein